MLNKIVNIVSNKLPNIVSRNDVIIVLSWGTCGLVLQIACKSYLKYLEENSETSVNTDNLEISPENRNKTPKIPFIWLRNRGGQLLEIIGFKAVINLKPIIHFAANVGTLSFFSCGLIHAFGPKILASDAVSTWIYKGLPYSYSDEEIKRAVIIDISKNKIMDNTWVYFFEFLGDPKIDYGQKLEKANGFLKKKLNFSNKGDQIVFVLLIVFLICGLSSLDVTTGFHALIQALLKALREGRLSKRVARLIIRKLKREKIPVDQELIDLAYN